MAYQKKQWNDKKNYYVYKEPACSIHTRFSKIAKYDEVCKAYKKLNDCWFTDREKNWSTKVISIS